MNDVARLAGVSLATVSRVVNDSGEVRPELAARVHDAVEVLGYRRDLTASNLRRTDRASATIGLIIEDVANPFFSAVHRGVEDVGRAHGVLTFAGSSDEMPERERELADAFGARGVDGLVIVPCGPDQGYLQREQQLGTQLVFVDRPARFIDADAVVTDNAGRGADRRRAPDLRAGHRRIALLGRPAVGLHRRTSAAPATSRRSPARRHRRRTRRSQRVGLVGERRRRGRRTHELLLAPDPPTALFTAQNLVTIGAIRALRELGAAARDRARRLRRRDARQHGRPGDHGDQPGPLRARPARRGAAVRAPGRLRRGRPSWSSCPRSWSRAAPARSSRRRSHDLRPPAGPIVVSGEALFDLVLARDGSLAGHPGGGPYNVARTIGRLEQPAAYLGRLSTDGCGQRLRAELAADGVALDSAVATDDPTTLALAQLDDEGVARYRFYERETSAPGLTAEAAAAALPSPIRAFYLGTLGLVLEPMASSLESLVARLPDDTLVALDPNCRPSTISDPAAFRGRLGTAPDAHGRRQGQRGGPGLARSRRRPGRRGSRAAGPRGTRWPSSRSAGTAPWWSPPARPRRSPPRSSR